MHKVRLPDSLIRLVRRDTVRVSLCWTAGLLIGTLFAARGNPSCSSMMRLAAGCRASIVGLAAAAVLPFLLAAYAALFSRPALLLAVCGCKAFCLCSVACLTVGAFGSAGWLIQPLLQFTGLCTAPLLCWFCLRHLSGAAPTLRRDLRICIFLALLAAGIDYTVVSPFLARLTGI